MEMHPPERSEDFPAQEMPEDIEAVYSWADSDGAKNSDLSANHREYRAQMRHRAAEQLHLMELRAQSEAEAAAAQAEAEAAAAHADADAASIKLAANRTMHAAGAQRAAHGPAGGIENGRNDVSEFMAEEEQVEHLRRSSLKEAAQQARRAAAERLEAARRAEAAALADSIARREEREIAEAQASALRQAAHLAESEARNRQKRAVQPESVLSGRIAGDQAGAFPSGPEQKRRENLAKDISHELAAVEVPSKSYEGYPRTTNGRHPASPEAVGRIPRPAQGQPGWQAAESLIGSGAPSQRDIDLGDNRTPQHRRNGVAERWVPPVSLSGARASFTESSLRNGNGAPPWEQVQIMPEPQLAAKGRFPRYQPRETTQAKEATNNAEALHDPRPRRDAWGAAWEQPEVRVAGKQPVWSARPETASLEPLITSPIPNPAVDASGPAWLYSQTSVERGDGARTNRPAPDGSKSETPKPDYGKADGPRFVDSLVNSGSRAVAKLAVRSLAVGSGQRVVEPERERMKAPEPHNAAIERAAQLSSEQVTPRWFALKGIFSKDGEARRLEQDEPREKKRDTPFVMVYAMAGGVGKTSLVATLGRTLSSLGESVLLADTTSQGLLPFYFGGSQLHPGVVRTFLPPSGSADAPVRMVSYDFAAEERCLPVKDGEAQNDVFDELIAASRMASRVLLDLDVNSGWMVARMAWMKPTVLVPLAVDMNSVIRLQTIERSFHGMLDAEGKALQPIYLLNLFDASLPLHLEIREVLRQQLGERLLPFAIRRANGVGEALAEGMTIVDYDPASEVAADYMEVANWLRGAFEPAALGPRNLRWMER